MNGENERPTSSPTSIPPPPRWVTDLAVWNEYWTKVIKLCEEEEEQEHRNRRTR